MHKRIEAMKLAYADLMRYNAHPHLADTQQAMGGAPRHPNQSFAFQE